MTKILKFFYEVLLELRMVKWPSRYDVLMYTLVVIFVVIVSSIILAIMDIAFANLMRLLIG